MYDDVEKTGAADPCWFHIFDATYRKVSVAGPVAPGKVMPDNQLPRRYRDGNFLYKANTLEELCEQLEIPLRHLPVADAYACLGNEVRQVLADPADVFDAIVNEVDLAAALDLAQAGFADHDVGPLADEGLDGKPFGRRSRYQRHVTNATHRHVQGARNRRGRKSQDIDFAAQ